ncbi:MAG: hypothetical protein AMXMBFR84_15340 [Candidatus Hydrogenedentota bacterium]
MHKRSIPFGNAGLTQLEHGQATKVPDTNQFRMVFRKLQSLNYARNNSKVSDREAKWWWL